MFEFFGKEPVSSGKRPPTNVSIVVLISRRKVLLYGFETASFYSILVYGM